MRWPVGVKIENRNNTYKQKQIVKMPRDKRKYRFCWLDRLYAQFQRSTQLVQLPNHYLYLIICIIHAIEAAEVAVLVLAVVAIT